MIPRTKLLKVVQIAALSFGASIAVAFDPILYRSITIVSIAPSDSIALYYKLIICGLQYIKFNIYCVEFMLSKYSYKLKVSK